ncbi:MAG: hypothetical protein CVV25_05365 [Ignavibacteriae bacterium HGW-Ignavibacteriae-4]|jgi:hypothetical protein|nr:MAG: hypothetical protein CVV25_05365 [Ignavibacteriae bacterium HGW-Ignavibacteriae-4]
MRIASIILILLPLFLLACTSAKKPVLIYELVNSKYYPFASDSTILAKDTLEMKTMCDSFYKPPYMDTYNFQKGIEFPKYALENEITGRVVVRTYANKLGDVIYCKIESSDNDVFNASALYSTIRQKFIPGFLKNGEYAGSIIFIPLNYNIRNK